MVRHLLGILEEQWKQDEKHFHDVYIKIEDMTQKLDVEMKQKPRICDRQMK